MQSGQSRWLLRVALSGTALSPKERPAPCSLQHGSHGDSFCHRSSECNTTMRSNPEGGW